MGKASENEILSCEFTMFLELNRRRTAELSISCVKKTANSIGRGKPRGKVRQSHCVAQLKQ
ncbi:MAG: hypothetical protein ACI9U2_001030 [Bradymonadia bacterium]|jgi:hypothetical protein